MLVIIENMDNMHGEKLKKINILLSPAAGTLEPPSLENVDSALLRLKNVGAVDANNDLTPLGRHLAALPVDVR